MRDTGLNNIMYQLCIQTKLHDNKSVVIKLFRLQNILKYKINLKTFYVSYGFLHSFQISSKVLLLLPLVFSSSCY